MKMPGWRKSTQGTSTLEKLPGKARAYLEFVEKQSGARIGMISTGPGREQTILVEEFAAVLPGPAYVLPASKRQGVARK